MIPILTCYPRRHSYIGHYYISKLSLPSFLYLQVTLTMISVLACYPHRHSYVSKLPLPSFLYSHVTLSNISIFQINTGLQHKVIYVTQRKGLPLRFKTLADRLVEVGYSTNMVGKWHTGFFKKEYTPNYRSFQNFFGRCHYSPFY